MTEAEMIYRRFARQYNYDCHYNVSNEYPIGHIRLNVWKKGLYRLEKSEWAGNTAEFVCATLDECFKLAFKHFGFN